MTVYHQSGAILVTVSDGIGWKGVHAPDGSLYVTNAPGGTYVGRYAPDGSIYVTLSPGTGPVGIHAPDGSMYINQTGAQDGSLYVFGYGATLTLSSTSITEDSSIGDLVGLLSVTNGSGTYAFTITLDPDSKFVLDVGDDTRLELEDTLDYETATSHSVTISADNGVDTPITRTFTITVLDVSEGDFLLLENGFYLLLESGDKLLLEAS